MLIIVKLESEMKTADNKDNFEDNEKKDDIKNILLEEWTKWYNYKSWKR